MKTNNIRLIVLGLMLSLSTAISAQQDQDNCIVRLKKNVKVECISDGSELQLFQNSTIPRGTIVCRIEKMNDTTAINAEANKKSGIQPQAVFKPTSISDKLKEIRFKDNNGDERYDVKGVDSIAFYYQVEMDGEKYLIPYGDAQNVTSSIKKDDFYKNHFKYDEDNKSLIFKSSDGKRDSVKIIINNNREERISDTTQIIHNVEKGSVIRLITSSNTSFYEDIVFTTNDIENVSPKDKFQRFVASLPWWLHLLIGVVLGGFFALLYSKRKCVLALFRSKKNEKMEVDQQNRNSLKSKQSGINSDGGNEKHDIGELKKIVEQFNAIEKRMGELAPFISKMSTAITEISENEKKNKELKEKLEAAESEKNALDDKIAKELTPELDGIKEKNNELSEENKKLKPGKTILISGSKSFAKQAKDIMEECRNGEKCIQNYISSLSSSDKGKMSYFLATYTSNIPLTERDKWNGIIYSLGLNELFDTTPFSTNVVEIKTEREKVDWLKKRFVEELLQKYMSPLLIMLEQIRCANRYGIAMAAPKEINDIIKKIIGTAEKMKIKVIYIPLFEQIRKDSLLGANVEQKPVIPKEIENLVMVKEKNVPVFLERIGIEMDDAKRDKTIYVQEE